MITLELDVLFNEPEMLRFIKLVKDRFNYGSSENKEIYFGEHDIDWHINDVDKIFTFFNKVVPTSNKHEKEMLIKDDNIKFTKYILDGNDEWYVLSYDALMIVTNENYNFMFDKVNGNTIRFGKTKDEDPVMCKLGPEILDLEISVNGCPTVGGKNCKFCYKNNTTAKPTNMSLETFRNIIDRFPKNLSQIAFGVTGVLTNENFTEMLRICREEYGIVPNYTMSGADLTDEIIEVTNKYCGAVAISCYSDAKELCYKTIKRIHDVNHQFHINMHIVMSKDNFEHIKDVLNDIRDRKVVGLRNIVFLKIKPRGRAKHMDCSVTKEMLAYVIEFCEKYNIGFGFDSCSCRGVEDYYKSKKNYDILSSLEPCESSLFSSYINVMGVYWHCSFCENLNGYNGIDVTNVTNFHDEVWSSKEIENFRNPKERKSKSCQAFDLDLKN